MKKLLSLFIWAMLPIETSATEIDGINYNLSYKNKQYTATVISRSIKYSGDIIIPEKVTYSGNNYKVVSIGDRAFEECTNLSSITISDGVTSIGSYAFSVCYRLTNISIPNSVTSIGSYAFAGCSELSSIDLPNNLKSILDDAFLGCKKLTSFFIPRSVNSIGNSIFYGCDNLISISVDDDNPNYDSRNNCNAIIEKATNTLLVGCKTTIIPNSVIHIGNNAFSGCKSLTTMDIPNSVISIEPFAFSGCTDLTSLIIPRSVAKIGTNIIWGCDNLISISVDGDNPNYDSRDNCNAIIEKATNTLVVGCKTTTIPYSIFFIGESAFNGCEGLILIEIPNSIISIGSFAFSGCKGLASIDIPNSVKEIGNSAFYGCTGLLSISIPKSVTSIGNDVFKGCSSLKSLAIGCNLEILSNTFKGLNIEEVTFDCENITTLFLANTSLRKVTMTENVKTIAESAFSSCSGLTSIVVPKSIVSIGGDAFSWCTQLDSINISDLTAWCNIDFKLYKGGGLGASNPLNCYATHRSHRSTGNYPHLFLNGEEIVDMVIPKGTIIKERAFQMFEGLESVTILEGDESVAKNAFEKCYYLKKATICQNLGQSAFEDCNALDTVIIAEGVNTIGERAFFGSRKMHYVQIPKSVRSIGSGAFSYAYLSNYLSDQPRRGATDVHISDIDTWSSGGFGKAFNDNYYLYYNNKVINNLTITKEASKIGDYAFTYCSNSFTKLTIEEGITSIGNYAFGGVDNNDYSTYGCRLSIKSLIIPNSVNAIGNHAFYKCLYLDSIKIGSGVRSIGASAFSKTHIKSVLLPEGITSIENGLFYQCDSLKVVDIHGNITKIGDGAFSGTNISKLELPNSLNRIGENAFKETAITKITIPNQVTYLGSGAFEHCEHLSDVTLSESLNSILNASFKGCKSLKTIDIPNSITWIGEDAFMNSGLHSARLGKNVSNIKTGFHYCDSLKYIIITSDKIPEFELVTGPTAIDSRRKVDSLTCQFLIPHITFEKGIPENVLNFATYQEKPVYIKVDKFSATSAELTLQPVDIIYGYSIDTIPRKQKTGGLVPNEYINWETEDFGSGIVGVKTKTLIIKVQEPKALSTKKARLLATVEEADDVEHYGFEWRRIESSDMISSKIVISPLFNGKIVGTLNNLNPDIEYKYRPFYKSDSGVMFYGDWIGLFTGDADVYFEPEVYTKDAEDVTKVSALLAGVWFEGTDDFLEKGFEYWTVSGSKTRAVGTDVKKVTVSGSNMTATLEGLKAGATYGYRSYAKTASGTTYGEEKTFKTILIGDANDDGELTDADVKAIACHILGNTPTVFNKKMADVNGDNKVNVVDIVELNNLIGK